MSSFEKTFTKAVNDFGKNLQNPYVATSVALFLVLYGGLAAPNLPRSIAKLYDYQVVRLLHVFLIAYMGNKNPSISLLVAVAFILSVQRINKMNTERQINQVQIADEQRSQVRQQKQMQRSQQVQQQKLNQIQSQLDDIASSGPVGAQAGSPIIYAPVPSGNDAVQAQITQLQQQIAAQSQQQALKEIVQQATQQASTGASQAQVHVQQAKKQQVAQQQQLAQQQQQVIQQQRAAQQQIKQAQQAAQQAKQAAQQAQQAVKVQQQQVREQQQRPQQQRAQQQRPQQQRAQQQQRAAPTGFSATQFASF